MSASHLCKSFGLRQGAWRRRRASGGRGGSPFWALNDVNFEIERGGFFGVVGHNGSGKSTALKILAGVYRPTSGSVRINGRLSALLELGAGFHPELTGRENIQLNAAILGLSRRQVDAAMDEIVDFADIGTFIDAPVKVYSSGMVIRLGFSVAAQIEPEILLIDEIIAVGDEEFQRRCFDRLFALKSSGSTIVLVSHSLATVENMCDTAMWLDHGRARLIGPARDVVREYVRAVNQAETPEVAGASVTDLDLIRTGPGEIRVVGLQLLDESGRVVPAVRSGAPVTVRLLFEADKDMADVDFAIAFYHESGAAPAGVTSKRVGPHQVPRGPGSVDFRVSELLLRPGTYAISTLLSGEGHWCDHVDRAFPLPVTGRGFGEPGLLDLPGAWSTPKKIG